MTRARRTAQCDAVLAAVRAAFDHPTADQVHARVRQELPHISLGTVYRNLDKLSAAGEVRLLRFGEGPVRFDARRATHDHFLCDDCGVIVDIPPAPAPAEGLPPLLAAGFRVRASARTLHGRCPSCAGAAEEA